MPARKSLTSPIASTAQNKSEDDYRAESDHRTLREAEEVKADPGRMKRVGVVHQKMMRDLSRVGAKLKGGEMTPKRKMPKMRGMKRPSVGRSR